MDYTVTYKSKARGSVALIFKARCACGISKDVEPFEEDGYARELASELLTDAGWTNLDTDPTCARCSEVQALEAELKGRGRR